LIRVSPSNPTSSDVVVISVDHIDCGPISTSIIQSGFTFLGNITELGGCGVERLGTASFPPVGHLASGNYTVTIVGGWDPVTLHAPQTAAFSVIPSVVSAIPAIEPLGLVLIAAAILLVALPRLLSSPAARSVQEARRSSRIG